MKLFIIISIFLGVSNRSSAQGDISANHVMLNITEGDHILIYPMPVHGDAFRISGINTLKLRAIEVYDMSGNLVGEIDKEALDENGEISVEHFNNGTYVLSIIFADHIISRKIIIE